MSLVTLGLLILGMAILGAVVVARHTLPSNTVAGALMDALAVGLMAPLILPLLTIYLALFAIRLVLIVVSMFFVLLWEAPGSAKNIYRHHTYQWREKHRTTQLARIKAWEQNIFHFTHHMYRSAPSGDQLSQHKVCRPLPAIHRLFP
jgi:hypothetical protein